MTDIAHDPARHRFTAEVDGETAYLEYERGDDVMVITHTIVPPAIGGRGIAGDLVRAAVEHARAEGLKVDPRCSYADGWMRKHPEYEALRT
ncbi:MAG TPA: GNAT family N-acetyltransferase [Thermomonas sp.]|nr:GNAT family N-acetyltransferase [Thermomonas sp.]